MPSTHFTEPVPGSRSTPAPLAVAASLAGLEGALLAAYGVLELAALDTARVAMGLTTALFFLAYGAGLALCAFALHRRHSWARGPVVLTQLIQLGVAWSFRGGSTAAVAAVLAVVAVVTLAGVFHRASMEALEAED